jgi:hypothetical protein
VVYYLLGDHLGSTSLTVDASGNKVSEMRFKPYGETRYSGPPAGTPTDYRFTGQRRLAGLGLYHMGARFYDACPLAQRRYAGAGAGESAIVQQVLVRSR